LQLWLKPRQRERTARKSREDASLSSLPRGRPLMMRAVKARGHAVEIEAGTAGIPEANHLRRLGWSLKRVADKHGPRQHLGHHLGPELIHRSRGEKGVHEVMC